MKKIVIAVSAATIALPAFAQSSVTLYGVLDEALQLNTNAKHVVGSTNVGGRQWSLDSLNGPYGSRWGIKGREDLGGGLAALFTLESGVNLNTGAFAQGGTAFGRQAFVGLSSNRFGTLTLGRQYDSVNDYLGAFEFGLAAYGSGASHPGDIDNGARTYRQNNSIKYASPNFSGLRFGGTVMLGGIAGSVSQNSGYTAGVGYNNGPLGLGVVYQFFKNPSNAGAVLNGNANAVAPATTSAFGSINSGYLAGSAPASSWQVIGAGGQYTFGSAAVGMMYSNVKYGNIGQLGGATATFNNFEINGMYRLSSAAFVSAAYNYTKGNAVKGDLGDQTYHQFSAVADYSLSKRTDLYVAATYQMASGTSSTGAPAVADISLIGDSSNSRQALVRLGMRHMF
ncbi:porin [Paraburkholderia sp. ZP32-5]|uniref:porin n=1 Tax=Paraburkholderia sp. ZP32-5 TaxID=2883245 RepID=UPI001F27E9B3|nr:porin [Paraburkholderia sp. ZP32-5]